ncbi:MAG: tRNA (N(6)-L-threonylcarbamoyladenosine(37)-C(2))-methylthiotransferase [Candidatus Micrarchaeaceae archaeon]
MRIAIKTYGCTLNQADSSIIKSVLESAGNEVHEINDLDKHEYEGESVLIVNTCAVKKPTQQKILYELQKLESQHMKVIATGCLASASPELIGRYAPNASIVTISNIDLIGEAAKRASEGRKVVFDSYRKLDRLALFSPKRSVVAKIPLGDGCMGNCSFCETKFARGPLNSFSEEQIIKAIELSVRGGAKEVELTAQDTGAYGADRKTSIIGLLKKVSMISGDFKVRLGMMNPQFLGAYSEGLAEILNDGRFYRFLHVPVQSGSDRILKSMRRPYTIEEAVEHIDGLRKSVNGITIETDIIVGFPGESDEDFEMTMEFMKSARPDITNISKFGAMPHADASRMPQLGASVISMRSVELSRLARRVQTETNNKFIGSKVNILITEANEKSFKGRMYNYRQVVLGRDENVGMGMNYEVEIERASSNALYGRLV